MCVCVCVCVCARACVLASACVENPVMSDHSFFTWNGLFLVKLYPEQNDYVTKI